MSTTRQTILLLGSILALGLLNCSGGSDSTTQPVNPPRISLAASSASFNAVAGAANPNASNIDITNSGGGTLSGLAIASTTYASGQPTGWLNASLSGTTAPATLTLSATTGALPAGTYNATTSLTSSASGVSNSPQMIAVTFTIAPQPAVLTSITVSLSAQAVDSGGTVTATAAGKDQYGAAIATGAVTWSSSATNVATVSSTGVVSALAPGQTSIKATAGAVSGTTSLTVNAVDLVAACRLPAKFPGVALGFPRVAGRLKSVGDVHMVVVFVDFSDAVATRTPQSVFGIISPAAENYYKAVSYGRLNLILQPTYTWYRMSKPPTQYGWSGLTFAAQKEYSEEALTLAATTDLSQADGFVILANPDATALANGPAFAANPGTGVTVRGKTLDNGLTSGHDLLLWGSYWLNHEMGHTMSLVDDYAFSGATHRFVGGFSLMGLISGFAREYFGWERWQLGWIDDAQVSCDSRAGIRDVTLSPIERAGGTKMIVIPTGTTTALVVESRRAEGYDTNGTWSPGVLVYSIDTSIATGNGPLKVLPINDNDISKGTAPLQPGGSMTVGGVTITFLSTTSSGDVVRVTR